mgnify:FL=1
MIQACSNWRSYRRVPEHAMPHEWRSWVLDRGSLTKRLIRASSGQFRVNLKHYGWAIPSHDESRILGIKSREQALIREVELLCFEKVWVCARSVIPCSTLSGEERQLQHLGTRPLGAYLFASRAMRRGPIELAKVNDNIHQLGYARRSVFTLHNKALLVSETFLPEILNYHA